MSPNRRPMTPSIVITWLICAVLSGNRLRAEELYEESTAGLFPSVFNLAESAGIVSNATCGDHSSEVYCKLEINPSPPANQQCGICDATEASKAHPIEYAIDGEKGTWWQAPSLQFGPDYHFVTITIDLKRTFQVAYILIKSGISPRPANWILERSIDGQEWAPWQFFALSDEECWHAFGVEPRKGKPAYRYDDEVICTSFYSKLEPMENGEIHVSLVNGRPGASGPSRTLSDFTLARFVRIRLRRLRVLPPDLMSITNFTFTASTTLRRYFYSFRDLTIGGQCPCNGHANECPVSHASMDYECKCRHNTCGPLCDKCCPMFNQKRWRPGKFISANECERCQCFGHADECFFDPQVEAERKSMNTDGAYEGGGVCIGCRKNTAGINCEHCKSGYYRPKDVSRFDPNPCRPCKCQGVRGSTGTCYGDKESETIPGVNPGDCVCKEGFAGPLCDQCARGYHRYPDCVPCPCSLAGTLNGKCDGICECKANVEGERCDRCKDGFYALHEANSEGCLECFCYGISTKCSAANLGVEVLQHAEGWKVTDLRGRLLVDPYWSTVTNGITIAEEDMQGLETYFWRAPELYIGNKIISYGQNMKISVSWHTGRGDTAGTYTKAPDIILEGAGMTIGFGAVRYLRRKNATIEVTLNETGWYHIPVTLYDIEARAFRHRRPDFIGKAVSKIEFMRILGSLSRLLIRTKYHTDQLEGTLHTAALEFGSQRSLSLRKTVAVEKCVCPQGYEGLSCESCGYGYTRVNRTLFGGVCKLCDCNGHAATCDPMTLECDKCQHNTLGPKCDTCMEGFYGNARMGTINDCKRCKCPLEVASNNFSPTCRVATIDYDKYSVAPEQYICNACPKGYAGPHCERCDNGYYGNPLTVGDFCKPCDCKGNANPYIPNWCDHRTGQCLQCLGNTGGWHCDECLPGYYGNPLSGQCKACDCNEFGSMSTNCDPLTGQCPCKDKYVGRTCSQCKDGFGNIRAGCRQCGCHPVGSRSDACDADSGQCDCHPGIQGLTCDECKPHYYGFSNKGCQSCDCHPNGSERPQCNLTSGSCSCRPLVEGRRCDACKFGHWNIDSGKGCERCKCDAMGSINNDCDDVTGQCLCKPGVGGPTCDACLAGYWGFSPRGCTECFPCEKPGHVCDPDTGRCVCPPLTQGKACEKCSKGSWDYHPYRGCRSCQCHPKGSASDQCDLATGRCHCLAGFEGDLCNKCRPGYYNFPHCWPCNCDAAGTREDQCDDNGLCQCDAEGACLCKANVEGKKCASCRLGTFGLTASDPDGCTDCFCFGRSATCRQADYVWTQLGHPGGRKLTISRGNSQLNVSHNLLVVPGEDKDITIGVDRMFTTPLYWNLPKTFRGDRVTAYNGYLRFTTTSNAENPFPTEVDVSYPLVQLQGNSRIVIEHYPRKLSNSGRYEVRFHEDDWVMKGNRLPVTRDVMMIALQRVDQILVRATDALGATKAQIHGVTLDVAAPRPVDSSKMKSIALRSATGIEVCDCPPKYKSESCQNPGLGFYRWYKEHYVTSVTIIDLVGSAKKCECNGRTENCHPETGLCMNCRENTAGPYCELCAAGFYGKPMAGEPCKACQCPTADRNFALTCSVDYRGQFSCQCQPGYTGAKCERCDYGFYGNLTDENGECTPCNCDPFGSLTDQCDHQTGQCYCVDGVTGRDCSQCGPRQVLTTKRTCKSCNDECSGLLLDDVDKMVRQFDEANVSDIDPAPMLRLVNYQKRRSEFSETVIQVSNNKAHLMNLVELVAQLKPRSELGMLETNKYTKSAKDQDELGSLLHKNSRTTSDALDVTQRELAGIIDYLENYAIGETPHVSIRRAVDEAKKVLADLKRRNHRQADIAARTELSYARQSLYTVKGILYGHAKLDEKKTLVEIIETKINDLLQYINNAMDMTRIGMKTNDKHLTSLEGTIEKCTQIQTLRVSGEELNTQGSDFLAEGSKILTDAKNFFANLDGTFEKMKATGVQLEGKEYGLSAVVEDYHTRFILPCRKNANSLFAAAQKVQTMFEHELGVNVDQTVRAAGAYNKIIATVDEARQAATKAVEAAIKAFEKASPPSGNLRTKVDQARVACRDLLQEAEGLRSTSYGMKSQMEEMKLRWQTFILSVRERGSDLEAMNRDMDRLPAVTGLGRETLNVSLDSLRESEEVHRKVSAMMIRISEELRVRITELQSFSPDELGNIPRRLTEARRIRENVRKQANYLSHRRIDLDDFSLRVEKQLSDLKSRIKMARNAAESIKISITNQRQGHPDSNPMGCSRSYRVNLTSSTTNEISLIYGIDTDDRDGLLVYLPNGDEVTQSKDQERNFMALEMVDRKIRFVWNNGAGARAIVHNVSLEAAMGGDLMSQEHMWYKITAERIGNIGRLNVRRVKPIFDRPYYHKWVVGESSPSCNVIDIRRRDPIYVGGGLIPNGLKTNQLLSNGRFVGVLYEMSVNKRNVGLWNYLENRGCRETHSGVSDQVIEHSCYTFNGAGYAMQRDIRNYDPRYLSVSMEVKSFDPDALIFFAINEYQRQHLALELRDGRIFLNLKYGPEKELSFWTTRRYNVGTWIKVEAARALRNGVETGVLRVTHNGVRDDLMDTIALPPTVTFKMEECKLYFGGVPPDFETSDFENLRFGHLLGSLRGITISNPGSNSPLSPLYTQRFQPNPFYGVEPNCERKEMQSVSFRGDGYVELTSQPLRSESSFGFSFRTLASEGLLLLSTFQGQANGDLGNFYSVSLSNGHLSFSFSSHKKVGNVVTFNAKNVSNDGILHTVSVNKIKRKVLIYLDDMLISTEDGLQLSEAMLEIPAPSTGGLFVGGIPDVMEESIKSWKMASSVLGFAGTIKDVAFFDDQSMRVVALNEPVTIERALIGRELSLEDPSELSAIEMSSPLQQQHFQNHPPSVERKETQVCRKLTKVEDSFHLSASKSSHFLFTTKRDDLTRNFDISVTVKTIDEEGILFIVTDRSHHRDSMLVYFKDGSIVVVCVDKTGQTISQMDAIFNLNTGQWLNIMIKRDQQELVLLVEEIELTSTTLNRNARFGRHLYVGGIPRRIISDSLMSQLPASFNGCLREIAISGEIQDIRATGRGIHVVQGCHEQVETGIYLDGSNEHILNIENNSIKKLSFLFRPDERDTFVLANLILGSDNITFAVQKQKIIVTSSRDNFIGPTLSLCDGDWHSVELSVTRDKLHFRCDEFTKSVSGFSTDDNVQLVTIGAASKGDSSGGNRLKGCVRNITLNGIGLKSEQILGPNGSSHGLINACPKF